MNSTVTFKCRNSGNCQPCQPNYCSAWLKRPPCYNMDIMSAAIKRLRERERVIASGKSFIEAN